MTIQFLDPRLPERFWSKCIPEPNSGCWLWFGALNKRGYGRFGVDGHNRPAHRIAYIATMGNFDVALSLDHLCRNTGCVNPAHLEPVSQRINVLRGDAPAAHQHRKTQCKNGHPFVAENIYVLARPDGRTYKKCRVCRLKPDGYVARRERRI